MCWDGHQPMSRHNMHFVNNGGGGEIIMNSFFFYYYNFFLLMLFSLVFWIVIFAVFFQNIFLREAWTVWSAHFVCCLCWSITPVNSLFHWIAFGKKNRALMKTFCMGVEIKKKKKETGGNIPLIVQQSAWELEWCWLFMIQFFIYLFFFLNGNVHPLKCKVHLIKNMSY